MSRGGEGGECRGGMVISSFVSYCTAYIECSEFLCSDETGKRGVKLTEMPLRQGMGIVEGLRAYHYKDLYCNSEHWSISELKLLLTTGT